MSTSPTFSDEHLEARARELLLDGTEELAEVGGAVFDVATRHSYWSRKTRELHEVPDDFQPATQRVLDMVAPEARPMVESALLDCVSTGQTYDLEIPITTAHGNARWLRVVGRPIIEGGRVVRLEGAYRDISAQKAREAELLAAYQRADAALALASSYQSALDRHATVSQTDVRGTIIHVNDRFCELTGYSREELIGANHRIINSGHHPRSFFTNLWVTITRGEPWQGELCNRNKSGDLYWVDTTIVPLLGADGVPERYVSIRYDITARKEADQKVQAALAQLTGFFDVSLDLLCLNGPNGRFIRVNRMFENVLGYRAEELEQRTVLELIHPDDVEPTKAAFRRLAQGETVIDHVNRVRCTDGTYRHFEWRSTPSQGVIYTAARDITERLNQQAEIVRARQAAEAANASKSAFVANMSHEIRTPLNGVIGLTGALHRTPLTPEQQEMVGLIKASGETLERLLSDILDLSKIEAGKLDLQIESVDLKDAIETAAQVHRVRARDKGVGLDIRYGERARGLFEGDAVRLRQVVSNLTSNAVKFTDAGQVTINIDLDDFEDETSRLVLTVEDTGVGFDEETAERLFGRFEQADVSISRSYGGTGLGLSITRSLVELMGGDISARSTPARGSCFTVTLPLQRLMPLEDYDRRQVIAKDEVSVTHVSGDASLRVLLAEDHPTNQRVVALILEPLGIELTIAANGREAVEAWKGGDYDLVLMDMQMPEMDGLSATRAIRALEQELGVPRTPVAMLSANAMPEHVDQAMEAGCDTHIAKPVTPKALIEGIELALALAGHVSREPSSAAA